MNSKQRAGLRKGQLIFKRASKSQRRAWARKAARTRACKRALGENPLPKRIVQAALKKGYGVQSFPDSQGHTFYQIKKPGGELYGHSLSTVEGVVSHLRRAPKINPYTLSPVHPSVCQDFVQNPPITQDEYISLIEAEECLKSSGNQRAATDAFRVAQRHMRGHMIQNPLPVVSINRQRVQARNGELLIVGENGMKRNSPDFVENYRGYDIFFSHISYNCPALKLYGYANDLAIRRAIDKILKKRGLTKNGKGNSMKRRRGRNRKSASRKVRYRGRLYSYSGLRSKFGKLKSRKIWRGKCRKRTGSAKCLPAPKGKGSWLSLVKKYGVKGAKKHYHKRRR